MIKVLVIGDGCQDVFRYGKCNRLCPEAPVPVMNPTRIISNGGMAINVLENLKALGIECDIVTNDIRPVKTRYVDEISNQVLLRVDENDKIKSLTAMEFDAIEFDKYNAIVISDYNKGFLSDVDIDTIAQNHELVFMDTKKKIGDWAVWVEVIKINQKEYLENSDWLLKFYVEGDLVVTNGKQGATLNFTHDFPITDEHEVRDLSGAGDTFFAALVASYLKNDDICESIRFANRCASWVVSQKGVVTINLEMI